jgi:DNA-binding GntR family transcriptional regulator
LNARPRQASSNVQKACAAIREAVASGRFAGGDRVREVVVAEMAGVSRTSVRQALALLAAEGYVELRPNRGAVVVDWSEENLLQVFDLRALLESYAAGQAAQHAGAEDVAAMRAEVLEFERVVRRRGTPDARLIAESNNRLHRRIIAAAGNARLPALLGAVVQVPIERQTFARYDRAALERSALQHRDIVEAIAGGDAPWAEATMRSHIHAGRQAIFGAAPGAAAWPAGSERPTP